MKKAVVLLSGGMDSALCLAMAIKQGFKPAVLHLNYGQRTERREKRSFDDLCAYYQVQEKLEVNVNYLVQIGGSGLTDKSIRIPEAKLDSTQIPSTYVPFRNGNILSIAASWAEVIEAQSIFIGAMQLDSSGYPDCSEEFFCDFEKAINSGTKPETRINILTPLMNLSKKDIVTQGMELGLPFELTWSCYKNSGLACGECDSCALRLRGFEQSGVKDPLEYEKIKG